MKDLTLEELNDLAKKVAEYASALRVLDGVDINAETRGKIINARKNNLEAAMTSINREV